MTTKPNSIAALLAQARQQLQSVSNTPALDAELLLAHCLNKSRTHLFTWPENIVSNAVASQYQQLIIERTNDVPLAYLTGNREFWSLDFKVTKDTLIPRPDTELLVQLSVELLQEKPGPVLDLGTGSGAIAVAIAHEIPNIRVDAVDQSEAALEVANYNAVQHHVQVHFWPSNWFETITQSDYQLVVSNPPYIAQSDPHLQRGGLQHEPAQALQANENGMADIKHIVANAYRYCRNGAWLLIEHGHQQGSQTRELMQSHGYLHARTERDIEQRERLTLAQVAQQSPQR